MLNVTFGQESRMILTLKTYHQIKISNFKLAPLHGKERCKKRSLLVQVPLRAVEFLLGKNVLSHSTLIGYVCFFSVTFPIFLIYTWGSFMPKLAFHPFTKII